MELCRSRLLSRVAVLIFVSLATCSFPGRLHTGIASAKNLPSAPGAASASTIDNQQLMFPVDFSANVAVYAPPYTGKSHGEGKVYVSKGR